MRLIIAQQVYERHPALRIGIVVAKGVEVRYRDPDLEQLKRLVEEQVRVRGLTPAALERHPSIASWRSVYESSGADPSTFQPPAEATIRRVLEGGIPYANNTVEDLLRVVTCAHFLPVGGFDLREITGDIVLRFSEGGEPFILPRTQSGGGRGSYVKWTPPPELTRPGEVVYSDDQHVLTRHWNWQHWHGVAITTQTRDLALFVEGPEIVITSESLQLATDELAASLHDYCGGEISSFVASARDGLVYELTQSKKE
jgi:DNA/RNA-binding domain of Phe-tRNA-synthetase-like protein